MDRTTLVNRLQPKLAALYPNRSAPCLSRVLELIDRYANRLNERAIEPWSERDVVLITYGDQVRRPGASPLEALGEFLTAHDLGKCISTIHLLPFFPYSSDDGFSVIDYRTVDPNLGNWSDVDGLGQHGFKLMFDLVLNHASRHSAWFQRYLAGDDPYRRYFIEADPHADLSAVTRPRSLPLLTEVQTSRGSRHVWTTFSDDQIDLNFADPDVLIEMLDVLLSYVEHGAWIIRLDAIAYLWKRVGTPCIHLPETHLVVKLMRDVLEAAAPGTILLTETNVPHTENVSYLGDGDEAQMVYQFSLAPLALDALLRGSATTLAGWLRDLQDPPPGTTFFNFTASHDGIGVRPLEGLVPTDRTRGLAEAVLERGGRISTRRDPAGTDIPYELNITYFDALGPPSGGSDPWHAQRFLASQAVMLALRGVPGVYFHSLTGTPNDQPGVRSTGRARSINRRKFAFEELEAMISAAGSPQQEVFDRYRHMLAVRRLQPAFHPEAPQHVCDVASPAVLALKRTSRNGRQHVLALVNLADRPESADLAACGDIAYARDLLANDVQQPPASTISLAPYQVAWLST